MALPPAWSRVPPPSLRHLPPPSLGASWSLPAFGFEGEGRNPQLGNATAYSGKDRAVAGGGRPVLLPLASPGMAFPWWAGP